MKQTPNKCSVSAVSQRQDTLCARYRRVASEALITDCARTVNNSPDDPFHGLVVAGDAQQQPWRFGIHKAVGGYHDFANPGDILCAALAACLDSTLRIIADRLGVRISALEISTTAAADVRGTLLVDRSVPVGFQHLSCRVRLSLAEHETAKAHILLAAAEHSCVILQTLRRGVSTEIHLAT